MRAVSVLRLARAGLGALIASAAPGLGAHAASFACTQASTEMERLVCGDVALGARDEIMARLYAAALKAGARAAVEARQRTWLRIAQSCTVTGCLAQAYDRRIAELQRSEGGGTAGTDFFTDEPDGNHGTLTVVGPIRGFASVSVTSSYVGAGGAEAGDVYATGTDAVLDLREGPVSVHDGTCTLTFARRDADVWTVTQTGTCHLPGGTVYAGVYRRQP